MSPTGVGKAVCKVAQDLSRVDRTKIMMTQMDIDFAKFKNRLKVYTIVGVAWTVLGMLYVWLGFPHTPYASPALGYPFHSVLYSLSIGGLLVFLFLYFIPPLLFVGFLLNIGQTTLIGELIYWSRNLAKK